MFSCIVHGWNSNDSSCPECHKTVTTTDVVVEESVTDNYIPYGEEWEKEMSKFPKAQLIKMLGNALQSRSIQPSSDQIAGMKDAFNDKTIKKTIKDLPKDYKWEDIFEIGIGIPTGTKNFLSTYFSVPNLASYNQSPSTGEQEDERLDEMGNDPL